MIMTETFNHDINATVAFLGVCGVCVCVVMGVGLGVDAKTS